MKPSYGVFALTTALLLWAGACKTTETAQKEAAGAEEETKQMAATEKKKAKEKTERAKEETKKQTEQKAESAKKMGKKAEASAEKTAGTAQDRMARHQKKMESIFTELDSSYDALNASYADLKEGEGIPEKMKGKWSEVKEVRAQIDQAQKARHEKMKKEGGMGRKMMMSQEHRSHMKEMMAHHAKLEELNEELAESAEAGKREELAKQHRSAANLHGQWVDEHDKMMETMDEKTK